MGDQKGRRHFLKYFFSLLAFGGGSIFSVRKNKGLGRRKSFPISINHSKAQPVGKKVSGIKKIAVEEHFTTEKIIDYLISRVKSGAKVNMPVPDEKNISSLPLIGDKRLKDMDKAGIDMQVISPAPFHEGFIEPSEGTAVAKFTNDETYRITKQYQRRFAGFAGLACQDPDAAARELERAVKDLGLKGAMIYSHIQGEYLDAKKFWVIFETAERLGVPIYLHPKEPSPDIIKPYLTYPALAEKIWGFGAEAGLHAMRLIACGLFDKYPGLQIILGHGGEALPFWLWRMGMRSDNSLSTDKGVAAFGPAARGGLLCKKQPGQYVKENFYVTTSGMFWVPVLQFLHSAMGPDRVLFAVDYPSESNILAVKAIESLPISNEDKEKIFYLNTERLLKL